MPGQILTTAATIQCPHMGMAALATTNTQLLAGSAALLESDMHVVSNCLFLIGTPAFSPCVTITWSAGADAVSTNGKKLLVTTSLGQCKNVLGVVQGIALIAPGQVKVSAR